MLLRKEERTGGKLLAQERNWEASTTGTSHWCQAKGPLHDLLGREGPEQVSIMETEQSLLWVKRTTKKRHYFKCKHLECGLCVVYKGSYIASPKSVPPNSSTRHWRETSGSPSSWDHRYVPTCLPPAQFLKDFFYYY